MTEPKHAPTSIPTTPPTQTPTPTPTPERTGGPRIYVASLSDYNAGRLHGRWIDASKDAAAIHAEIRVMLAESREPPAEEWAIHDSEGFGEYGVGEFESIEKVAETAALIAEHGEVFAGLLSHFGGDLDDAKKWMEEGYRGEWDSLAEYAENFIDDVYCGELKGLPDIIRHHIDYDGIAHDFEVSGDIFTVACDGKVHVFDSNI